MDTKTPTSSAASAGAGTAAQGAGTSGHAAGLHRRGLWFGAAAALLLSSTLVAVRQEPRADAYRPLTGVESFLQPVELNANKRLPLIWGHLDDVFVLPRNARRGPQVWVVGNGGLILHSGDVGRTWERLRLVAAAEASGGSAAASAQAAGINPLDVAGLLAVMGAQREDVRGPIHPQPANQGASGVTAQAPANAAASGSGAAPPAAGVAAGKTGTAAKSRRQVSGATGGSTANAAPGSVPATPAQGVGRAAGNPPQARGQEALARSDLHSVWFVDETTGWVAGDHGALFATVDGGKTWRGRQLSIDGVPIDQPLSQLLFEDSSHGWLTVGSFWAGLDSHSSWYRAETTNGGADWSRPALIDVQHLSQVTQVLRGPPERSLSMEFMPGNGLQSHNNPADRPGFSFPVLRRPGMPSDFGSGAGTRSYVRNRVDTLDWLLALDASAPTTLWAVGMNGGVYRKRDDGQGWQPAPPRDAAGPLLGHETLTSIAFLDPQHGWITGASGTLLATEDGGETWFRQTRKLPGSEEASRGAYSMWLAPWYFLSLLGVAGLLVPALRAPGPIIAPAPSVADRLISDGAINRPEADAFDFNAVALGLSRFLRNSRTQPPLTIAITGQWGSGKSSLMNLLRADLQRYYGFRPVWFNAWHHQKEEHLLASLLEAIRAQAVPPWWRPEGPLFRARLLRIRAERSWLLVAVLLIAFTTLVGYVWSDSRRLDAVVRTADALFETPKELFTDRAASKETSGNRQLPLTALLLVAAGSVIAAALRGAKAFGIKPASLLARLSPRVRDLEKLTGFRQRFGVEFSEVTAALTPRTMLILIDDLDRCRPEMMLEVLEAVNFLVTSGDCFVVLGMERKRVMRCIGLSFKDVASELVDEPVGARTDPTPEDRARQDRMDFAQKYLEKLINIEVPVPVPTDEQSRSLMVKAGERGKPEATQAERWARRWSAVRRVLPAAGIVALMIGGFIYGVTRAPAPGSKVASTASASEPAGQPAGQRNGAGQTKQPPPPKNVQIFGRATVRPPVVPSSHWRLLPFVLLGVVFAGLGAWRLSVAPDVVIHDSREFEEALARWHPLISSGRNTPRAIKRYLNRVRYLAMLQREPERYRNARERFSGWLVRSARIKRYLNRLRYLAMLQRLPERYRNTWERFSGWLVRSARSAGDGSPRPKTIPEQVIVALSAIDLRHPEWIDNGSPLASQACEAGGDEKIASLLPGEPDLERYRDRYRELSRGIRVGSEERVAEARSTVAGPRPGA